MNKPALFTIGMFLTNIAFGEALQSCSQDTAWKQSCINGEMMMCNNKVVDNKSHIFEWHAINEVGQTFIVDGPYYKKVAGYTPAKCTGVTNKIEYIALLQP